MESTKNAYCERLGIAVPSVTKAAAKPSVKLFHLLVIALLSRGASMSIEEIAECLSEAGVVSRTGDLILSLRKAWRGRRPVYRDPDGRFGLDLDAFELRMILRDAALETPVAAPAPDSGERPLPLAEATHADHAQPMTVSRARERRHVEAAPRARRAVVRVLPAPGDPQAASVLDVDACSIQTILGRDLAALRVAIERFDVVVGLHMRDILFALGLDAARFRVVDIGPPQKSRRLNKAGRTLKITPELLIAGTTGIHRPFGDPMKVARYLAEGDRHKLTRRIESDVKALYSFYQYGVLHGHVRLEWGFLHETLYADWALSEDVSLYQRLMEARTSGTAMDLVLGSAPGWSDPWARARRVRILDVDAYDVLVSEGEGAPPFPIARDEIQALREAPGVG